MTVQDVLKKAVAQGCRLEAKGNKRHPKIVLPTGQRIPFRNAPSKGDRRAGLNFRSQLRRAGLDIR